MMYILIFRYDRLCRIRIVQIHLDRSLSLWYVVQDLYSTYLPQKHVLQIIRLLRGNISQITQIKNVYALKDLGHEL